MVDVSGADTRRSPSPRRLVARPLAAPLLAFSALFLLFLLATPPASAPDEPSHFIRIGGVAAGQWIGPIPGADKVDLSGYAPAQLRRLQLESGVFHVSPRYLYIAYGDCNAFKPDIAACAEPRGKSADGVTQEISFHGRGLIGGYLAPAAFSALGWSGRSTFYLARLGALSVVLLLLSLAVLSVRRVEPSATIPVIAGIAVAYTPLAAFLSGVISPSATGIAGNIALLCTTWALARSRERDFAAQALWLVALVAACNAQRGGYIFAGMAVLAGLLSAGATPFSLWRRVSWGLLALSALTVAGALAWDLLTIGRVPSETSLWSLRTLSQLVEAVWITTKHASTLLGWLDVSMPAWITTLWSGLYVWCIVGAMVLSGRRWTFCIAILAVVYFCIGIAIAYAYKPTGFGLQARFFLPGLVLFPVASLLHLATLQPQRWRRLSPHALYAVSVFGMSVALITLLHRHVVGKAGPLWFFDLGEFRPLGGWLLLGCVAALFLIGAGATFREMMKGKFTDAPDLVGPGEVRPG